MTGFSRTLRGVGALAFGCSIASTNAAASPTTSSTSTAGSADCELRCDDLDFAARQLEAECERAGTAVTRDACAADRERLAAERRRIDRGCSCKALLEERRRERSVGIGIALSVPSYFPRFFTEVNLFEGRFTIGAVVGIGRATTRDPSTDQPTNSVWAYEVGPQIRWYPYGTFTHGGVALGVELLYARAQVEDLRLARGQVVPGIVVGPFAALRIPDFPIIHTVELTAGVGLVAYDKREGGGGRVGPIGSLGFGWVF